MADRYGMELTAPQVARARHACRAGELLREIEESGLSYRECAKDFGVSGSTVLRWARGETSPRGPAALRLGAFLAELAELKRDRTEGSSPDPQSGRDHATTTPAANTAAPQVLEKTEDPSPPPSVSGSSGTTSQEINDAGTF